MRLLTVVRDKVWQSLRSANPSFTEEVRQCIGKIEKRQFDFGLRVKKLKGVSKIVWEARIDRSSRLLFTYRQSNHHNGQSQKFIAIEAICREHDGVIHQAKEIDRNWWEEAEEIAVLGDLNREFAELEIAEQAEIRALATAEIEIQAASTDELLDRTKWFMLESATIESAQEWQMAIASKADLRLRLTPDESKAIDTYGNMLLSGSAGTGKTTVGLYRLARTLQLNPAAKCLYTGYNPILIKESEQQFKQLWGEKFTSLPFKVDFLTIKDLCLQLTKSLNKEFDLHLVDYPYFRQQYLKKPESKQYPPSLVWDEIRSIIKGANLTVRGESYLLSQKEYDNLGKKRSGVIRAGERYKIYKLAQWYQNCLNRDRLADEIDLAQAALREIETARHQPYTLVICDEVQDFTEIQLEILIRLLAQNGQILCAGDINQMINPSGFRWEDLTSRLYRHDRQWTETSLEVNFRSTGKLGELAVQLLNLKFRLLSESKFYRVPALQSSGELARLVTVSGVDLQQIDLGSGDAILVRTEEQKEELVKSLKTKLIFTIEGSKGLEFDTVYLVNFFRDSSDLWSTAINSPERLKDRQKPALRLEFNLLYVAITRPRRVLNICETEIADLWKQAEIAQSLISMSIKEACSQARSIAPQDWYQKAIYYRDAKFLPQALECAFKSGDDLLKQEIAADLLLLDRQYEEAAQLLLKIEKYPAAAEIFERIEAWQQASEIWDLAGNPSRKQDCQHRYGQTYFVRGTAKYQARQYQDAIADYDRAIAINPQHANAYVGRGTAKYGLGKYQAAIPDHDRAIEIDPEYATAYNNRGLAKYSLGQNQAAINDYDRAIEIDPQAADPYNNRGTAKFKLGEYQAAINDYDRAIEIDPEGAAVYYNRGFAKYNCGQHQAAINDYDRAIKIDPQDADAYNSRGTAKHSLGQYQAAINDYDRAIEIDPEAAAAYCNRGLAKYSLGQYRAAIADYDRLITLNPQDAATYNNRGAAKYSLGRHQEAIDDCSRAIAIAPQYADAYNNRGTVKQNLGRDREAMADFAKAAELFNQVNRSPRIVGDRES
jgi:tetratricopeptide (TPR) repeat protein